MEYLKIKDLPLNEKTTTVVLLTSIEERKTKNGDAYCHLFFTDGDTQIGANLWNTAKSGMKIPEKPLLSVELYPKLYQGALSYEVFRYGPAPEDCKIEDFIPKAPYAPTAMYQEILTLLRKEIPKKDPLMLDLVDLVEFIYMENMKKLLYWSAGENVHHNFFGGLLYHVFRMLRTGVLLSRVYSFDKELLLCGIALHDIGKLDSLETDSLGFAEISVDGNLFGHSLLGVEMITDSFIALEEEHEYSVRFNREKVRLLKHMLAAHHGQLDDGSITVPAIPEAMLLCEIDRMNSHMRQFEQAYQELSPGEMSARTPGLGTCVYKPLKETDIS